MNFKYLFILIFSVFITNVNGQSANKDILFSIDDEPVYVSEFLRVYNKNLDLVQDESQKDVDEYLSLFTNYKLKLKEAKALELQEKPTYIRELDSYKKQLAKSFITDAKVTDALVEEAYERISNDVKASHILIKIPEDANPNDTLTAYNSILNLRNRALKEGFDKVRQEVHNGQTVYGEDLGYFSGFRMVYPFENAAFNTKVGDISQPFRTRFGYHIVYVQDKRKSRGERTVAHIMVVEKPGDSLAEKPENRIQDIYKKLKQGEDFEALAKQFSDDTNSAPNGGMLAPFSSGQINSNEFEGAAFGLNEIGEVSEPFKTQYGWHIVKLYGKKPIASFEDMKSELEQKVKRDERSKLIDEALYTKLKTKYNIPEEQPALTYFTSILNTDYFKSTWQLPKDFTADKPLVKIGNKQLTYKDFGDYLVSVQRNTAAKTDFKTLASKHYNAFLNTNLVTYQEDNLENENEEYAHVVAEYRDGLLLFDLMETTIWNTAKTDSLEIQDYYNSNKNKYLTPKRVDAVVASSKDQKTLKKVGKLLKKGMALQQIKALVNSNDKIDVIFTVDTMDVNHQALPKGFEFKEGISKIYNHNNAFVLVQVKEVLPETQKTLEEAKGLVISDYQAYKEEKWLKELAEKYKIVINQEALKNVKSQIKNQ
ncbi:Chaperone SurA precursor [Mariniflexile rhizosphaerae]|uniref:peptidylprolyl isomerase n=1 Tax=unclassified Mariniflexile TaxID=2643887 RepID=UPI000CC30A85|nr:peptidylprolyl isomerase [Mariniflexile sp. TRM1-10]AXP81943.1 Chaperone SurA precursor [Mariniflexile sp. TRM1-10]PLB18034.1 MAG: PpiC-type peptidyl-prolyl cis-trans isomerase [Flavobacteriaceae bacterium FS1-H7996/R]